MDTSIDNAVALLPENSEWQPLFESLGMFTPDYMNEREQPPQQEREAWRQ